jgi:hypothetical protein
MTDVASFAAEGDVYRPLDLARSYWSRDALGGRAIVGLLGYEIERRHGAAGSVPARLTVDMFRLAPFRPLQIASRIIRDSARLLLVEADLMAAGEIVARATCQFLRSTAAPPGQVWSPGPWDAPPPKTLAPVTEGERPRSFELRTVRGSFGGATEKHCWIREKYALVEGVPHSAFSRAAIAADYASPLVHAGDAGIRYINTDITLHLHRLPEGEWIGFEATGHEASQGIAIGHCRLHDSTGAIGFVSCTALAQERRKYS